jgi:hypothetical protein
MTNITYSTIKTSAALAMFVVLAPLAHAQYYTPQQLNSAIPSYMFGVGAQAVRLLQGRGVSTGMAIHNRATAATRRKRTVATTLRRTTTVSTRHRAATRPTIHRATTLGMLRRAPTQAMRPPTTTANTRHRAHTPSTRRRPTTRSTRLRPIARRATHQEAATSTSSTRSNTFLSLWYRRRRT